MLQFLDKEIDVLFLKLMALGDGDATVEVSISPISYKQIFRSFFLLTGVNFINILRVGFLYQIFAQKITKLKLN